MNRLQMDRLNNFPVVFFHGFAGFGENERIHKYVPYFGLYNVDIIKMYDRQGTKAFIPSMSGFTSMWDRACEAYAQIVGGTVDYGKVHSEKMGHARYGRTYKAMYPEWGTLDTKGKIRKINVMGHSYGGPTVRFFVQMMITGNQEEIDGTPENELSNFFKGGKANWIHSCITLAAANDGISFLYAIEKPKDAIAKAVLKVINVIGNSPIAQYYDPQMDQWGLSKNPEDIKGWKFIKPDKQLVEKYYYGEDCVLNDLIVHKVRETMKDWQTQDCIYYFSYSASRTKKDKNGNHMPIKGMIPPMIPTAKIVGKYSNKGADANHAFIPEEWKENDGLVNTVTEQAPKNERWEPYSGDRNIKPGIWYDMPVEEKDHISYMGFNEKPSDFTIFFYDILRRISNLPAID